jgi:hypothetical protein
MYIMHTLVGRDIANAGDTLNPTVANLLVTLIILLIVGMVLAGALVVVRRRRRARKQSELPLYDDKKSKTSNHRRLTIMATPPTSKSKSIYVNTEKQTLVDNSSSPPSSPVPEIRITFPEEEDAAGRRQSGRVVVVRISETGSVGMEPYATEHLPPYQQNDADRFHSLDLDRIGGLKENRNG